MYFDKATNCSVCCDEYATRLSCCDCSRNFGSGSSGLCTALESMSMCRLVMAYISQLACLSLISIAPPSKVSMVKEEETSGASALPVRPAQKITNASIQNQPSQEVEERKTRGETVMDCKMSLASLIVKPNYMDSALDRIGSLELIRISKSFNIMLDRQLENNEKCLKCFSGVKSLSRSAEGFHPVIQASH